MSTYPNLKLLIAITALLISTNIAVAQTISTIDTANLKEIRINPAAAIGDDVAADDIFGSVEYIPLETNPKSLFGKVDLLEMMDDHFIILDREAFYTTKHWTSSILIFKKDGRFRARIDGKDYRYFAIDHEKKEIVISEGGGAKVTRYTIDGKLVKSDVPRFHTSSFAFLPGGYTAHYRGFMAYDFPKNILDKKGLTGANLVILNRDSSIINAYMPFDSTESHKRQYYHNSLFFTRSVDEVFMNQPYNFDILSFDKTRPFVKYRFIFTIAYTLPANFLVDSTYKDRENYHNANPRKFFEISNFYHAGNILSFKLDSWEHRYTYFYNLKNNLLTASPAIKLNESNVIVPLTEQILATDGTLMYTWLKAAPFFSQKRSFDDIIKVDKELAKKMLESGRIDAIPVDLNETYKGDSQKLKQFLKTGSAKSNPVLIALKVI